MSDPGFRRQLRKAEKFLASKDPQLAEVIARVGPCAIEPSDDFDPFHALVRSICHQQLHGKAAETIHQRVKDAYGDGHAPDVKLIVRARMPGLRKCGLSEAKSLAVKDLAKKCLDGTVPNTRELANLGDDEIVDRISTVRGVGRWTVEMMLLFRMGRLDVWPVDDFAIRKGFTMLRKLKEPITARALLPHGDVFKPYRSVASWYLWRIADGL